MGYNELEIELRRLLAELQRWRELGGVPAVEQGAALVRLQGVYMGLRELPVRELPVELPVQGADGAAEAMAETASDVASEVASEVTSEIASEVSEDHEVIEDVEVEEEIEVEEGEEKKAEKAEKVEKEGKPTILGVPVSAYARQEIVSHLFHGNLPLFEQEIARFDGMDSLDQALLYIGEMFHWVPEQAATIKFIDILETRFKEVQ